MSPLRFWLAVLASAAALAGCGGGFIVGDGFFLSINGFIDGRSIGDPIRSGTTVSVAISPGQSAQFDANEPADWRFSVNGGPFTPAGTAQAIAGLTINVRTLGPSAVAVDTALAGPVVLPVVVTLVATSTRDAAQVATVQLQVR